MTCHPSLRRHLPAVVAGLVLVSCGKNADERAELRPDAAAPVELTGTSWRLEDLAGRGVVAGMEATLEFPEPGIAEGNGTCNRFRGPVTVTGGSIRFGALISTKRACVDEAANAQETGYLAALGAAERWEIRGDFLFIYPADRAQPLRLARH
jgi:heat shock protein HslJ